jgi:hypothetical protein
MLPTKFWFIWPGSSRREDFFRNQPIRNKNGLCRPWLLTDRDEMSNLYRGPTIDASYQVSVHLAKQFQRRRFLKICQLETRIACGSHEPWLLMDWNKMSNLYKGPSIDASYQVSVHLAERFQRRRFKYEKLTDDRCQVMAKAHIAFGKVS